MIIISLLMSVDCIKECLMDNKFDPFKDYSEKYIEKTEKKQNVESFKNTQNVPDDNNLENIENDENTSCTCGDDCTCSNGEGKCNCGDDCTCHEKENTSSIEEVSTQKIVPQKNIQLQSTSDISVSKMDINIIDNTNKKRRVKSRVPAFVIILCIILPIFTVFNLFVCNYVFTLQQEEFTKILEDKQKELEEEFNSKISYNVDLVAYSVAKECLSQNLEITSISTQKGISTGSAFIISKDGYVLTNAHVVIYEKSLGSNRKENIPAEQISANFADSPKKYEMKVIGFSIEYDLALLQFKTLPKDLNVAAFANSTDLAFGEPCVAIGDAKGKGTSVTEGIISNPLQNFNFGTGVNTPAIQHSAPINNGNSGGPLYNMHGQVIGINAFKFKSSSDTTEGMGYALPSVLVKDWVNSLNVNGLRVTFEETPEIGK